MWSEAAVSVCVQGGGGLSEEKKNKVRRGEPLVGWDEGRLGILLIGCVCV